MYLGNKLYNISNLNVALRSRAAIFSQIAIFRYSKEALANFQRKKLPQKPLSLNVFSYCILFYFYFSAHSAQKYFYIQMTLSYFTYQLFDSYYLMTETLAETMPTTQPTTMRCLDFPYNWRQNRRFLLRPRCVFLWRHFDCL